MRNVTVKPRGLSF